MGECTEIENRIRSLADECSERLGKKVDDRTAEMEKDDTGHWLIYRALGVADDEGKLIDLYQNKGRFLYRYAGTFLEIATRLCFSHTYPNSHSATIANPSGTRPKKFEIDCLISDYSPPHAIEIKWRDATTDGDHINKEHRRVQAISGAGYCPIRVMFYYPNRRQAQRIQGRLETLYREVGGEYHCASDAWEYVEQRTGVDLLSIIEAIASERKLND